MKFRQLTRNVSLHVEDEIDRRRVILDERQSIKNPSTQLE